MVKESAWAGLGRLGQLKRFALSDSKCNRLISIITPIKFDSIKTMQSPKTI